MKNFYAVSAITFFAFVLLPIMALEAREKGKRKGIGKEREYNFAKKLSEEDKEKFKEIKASFKKDTADIHKDIKSLYAEIQDIQSRNGNYKTSDLENLYNKTVKLHELRGKLHKLRYEKHMDISKLLSDYPEHQKKFLNGVMENKRKRKWGRSNANVEM